ncbi:MAG: aldehyde dehydrogenase family protein [Planctomycetota bacterium]|nr:aldehyde dehydrogenase family protein [Planctomycetota bacterium]
MFKSLFGKDWEDMIDGSGEGVIKVRSPFDQSLIATLNPASEENLERALRIAANIVARKAWLATHERVDILTRAADVLAERRDDFARLIAAEGGKPLVDARVEAERAKEGLRLCVEFLRTDRGEEIPMGLTASSEQRLAFTTREPIGMVAALSAFNHPLNLIVHQIGPAIAAGCPVIVKPAADTPLSCLALVRVLREVGLPEEYCQVLVFSDRSLAERLAIDPRVAFLSFIGSARVGWMLRSKLAPGTRCALEHGGAAPVIVTADADISDIAPRLVQGAFYHAGQVCVSVQRIFADEAVAETLANAIAQRAKALVVGDPLDEKTKVGPLIRPREVDRVEEWVDEARNGGATVLCGGKRISDSCYAPTVMLNPPIQARISQEEVFGPVVTVTAVKSMEEGIARANSLPFAFQAAVCTSSLDKAMEAFRGLNASAVMINDHTAFRVDWMPFAGLKHSGYGVGGIEHSLRDMQIEKLCVIRSKFL